MPPSQQRRVSSTLYLPLLIHIFFFDNAFLEKKQWQSASQAIKAVAFVAFHWCRAPSRSSPTYEIEWTTQLSDVVYCWWCTTPLSPKINRVIRWRRELLQLRHCRLSSTPLYVNAALHQLHFMLMSLIILILVPLSIKQSFGK